MDIAGQPIYAVRQFESDADSEREKNISEPDSPEQIASQIRLLSPLPYSSVTEQKVPIICIWGSEKPFPLFTVDLRIDGALVPWEMQFGKNAWVVNVDLSKGPHTIETMISKTEIFAGSPSDSKWKPLKIHPGIGDVQRCGDCHLWIDRPDELVRQGHGLTIGVWKGNESCTDCHSEPDFRQKHASLASPNESCRSCHIIHGTLEPGKLLKEKK